jgi:hypothetical protein
VLIINTDAQEATSALLSALQILPASRHLPSGSGCIRNDILRLISAAASDHFDFDRTKPLLEAVLADKPSDALIWDLVTAAAFKNSPPLERLRRLYNRHHGSTIQAASQTHLSITECRPSP